MTKRGHGQARAASGRARAATGPRREAYPRAGRAARNVLWIGALGAVSLLVGVYWVATRPPEGRARSVVADAPESAALQRGDAREEPLRDAAPRVPRDRGSPDARAAGSVEAAVEPPPVGARRGILRGEVALPAALPRDAVVTVHFEPSLVLRGREHAIPHEVTLAPGESAFVIEDLPLAGYDVLARAPGHFSRRQPVLLSAGAPEAYVLVTLHREGALIGRVVDPDGAYVEDLLVVLVDRASAQRRESRTRADGVFHFPELADGSFRLFLGSEQTPYAAPLAVDFRAPSMDVGELVVPRLHPLAITVVDASGRPVSGARVRGLGSDGGVVDVTTDLAGEARVALLVAGEYRLRAEHPELGRGARLETVTVGGREPATATIELRP